jgi:hypothetical protein
MNNMEFEFDLEQFGGIGTSHHRSAKVRAKARAGKRDERTARQKKEARRAARDAAKKKAARGNKNKKPKR